MNAVAIMTPEPKYLHMKNAQRGMLRLLDFAARIGNNAPVTRLANTPCICEDWQKA